MKRLLGLHLAVELSKSSPVLGFTSLRWVTGQQAVLDADEPELPGLFESSISSAYIPTCAVGLAKEAPLADQSASGIQPPDPRSEEAEG